MQSEEKLLELKKRILEKTNKNSAILLELQELNKSFSDLKEVVSNSKDLSEIKENIELLDRFDKLSKDIRDTNLKIKELTEKEIPTPKLIIPREFKVSNLPEKQAIDWENAPKQPEQRDYVEKPIKTLYKSVEGLLGVFFAKVGNFITKILEYILEPDRIVISDNKIEEYYGDRKITYRIKDINNNEKEIRRET